MPPATRPRCGLSGAAPSGTIGRRGTSSAAGDALAQKTYGDDRHAEAQGSAIPTKSVRATSSASLGWGSGVGVDGLSADGTGAGPGGQEGLQFVQDHIQAQAGTAAFGLVRNRVMNSW